ncbi:MAG: hypothetical protein OER95_02880 [Acidimicrobiia bacterium]|nr:hypothetical protein [Acidimicrobiia bacterium]
MPGLDAVWALHDYGPVLQRYLVAAKNQGRRDLLDLFGRRLAELPILAQLDPEAMVTWVPASRAGRRRRGYDQGRLLARAVGRHGRRPVLPLLSRAGSSGQAGLGRSQRLVGPDLSCRVSSVPARLIVIDDVITTGASLAAAAAALRQAGALGVIGLCVASADSGAATARRPSPYSQHLVI